MLKLRGHAFAWMTKVLFAPKAREQRLERTMSARLELMAKTVVAPLAALALLVAAGSGGAALPPPNVFQFDLAVDIDYVDPALAFYVPTWQIEYATCSRLVNFPDAPAPEGNVLQPEIAAALPIVSPDGLTYTFTVRDDYVFSPPSNERVTAAHFKYAIDRLQDPIMHSPAQRFGFMDDIAQVVASGNTLTVTLTQPSGDFLPRLAMPFFCPLPTSAPIEADGIGAPVPSAGPYYIASWTRNQEIVVRENPNYAGSRPHHFDEIRYTIGLPLETIRQRIETGDADLGDLPAAAHAELGQRYGPGAAPQRYFVYPAPTILYLAMNHDRPLFGSGGSLGDVNLKRAVNYAIDREALMAQRGAYAGTTTDQYLPPEMPGFRDVAIYPDRPNVALARQLAGWTPGDPVRNGILYCSNRSPAPQQCQIVQANLRQIGIEMEIKLFPRALQFELTGRRGEPFDMTLEGWHEDYHDPFDFLFLLDGTQLGPVGSTGNTNFAYFDDPGYNTKIQDASELHGDARTNAFGELDVDIAQNAAPWAPYGVANDRHLFSERIGCQIYVPAFGISLGALCLRPTTAPPPSPPPDTQPPDTQPPPDAQPPTDPNLRSTSHRVGAASTDRTVDIAIEGAIDSQSGIDGFSFAWDRQQATLPDTVKDAEETVSRTTSPALANGRWSFHLRTRDNAGNWTLTRHLGPFVIVPRARCVVPNVRRETVRQARRMLTARSCALGKVTGTYSAEVKRGRVISQSRRPGVRLPRGTRVKVVVSRGRRR
jgi:peptide/nickel transport system substrate-binding protein